jgi:hypothetical protein
MTVCSYIFVIYSIPGMYVSNHLSHHIKQLEKIIHIVIVWQRFPVSVECAAASIIYHEDGSLRNTYQTTRHHNPKDHGTRLQ